MNEHDYIGYLRVSTNEQAQHGISLKAQGDQILRFIEYKGWKLADLFVDEGQSAKTLDRPELQKALKLIARGQTAGLIVAKLDRLSRSTEHMSRLLDWFDDARTKLIALDMGLDTSTPGGRMVSQLFAVVAEWERRTTSERTRAGLSHIRAQGRPISPPAVYDRSELATAIRQRRLEGWSFHRICQELNEQGVPTVRGGECWRPSALQALLSGPRRSRSRSMELPEISR